MVKHAKRQYPDEQARKIRQAIPSNQHQPEEMPAPRLWYAVALPFRFHVDPAMTKVGSTPISSSIVQAENK